MQAKHVDEANEHYDHALNYAIGRNGYKQDQHRSYMHFYNAAMLGHPASMYYLAQCFRMGKGIKRDEESYRYWVKQCINTGSAPAQAHYSQGVIKYTEGDYASAVRHLDKGYLAGHKQSGLAYVTISIEANKSPSESEIAKMKAIIEDCVKDEVDGAESVRETFNKLNSITEYSGANAIMTLH